MNGLHESVKLGYCYEGSPVICPESREDRRRRAKRFCSRAGPALGRPMPGSAKDTRRSICSEAASFCCRFGKNSVAVNKIVDAAAARGFH